MPLSAVKSTYIRSDLTRYEQGDILRDITVVEWADVRGEELINVQERILQYCVIVSQECDLEHDFNARSKPDNPNTDKYLQSVLISPAYPSQDFRNGDHLKKLNMKMQSVQGGNWDRLKQNQNPRYHYLEKHDDFQVPELVVDFKHYITVPRNVLYRDQFNPCYIASMEILHRDHLSNRFAHYLSRIGLPDFASG